MFGQKRADVVQKINAAVGKSSSHLKLTGSLISQITELPAEIGTLTCVRQLDLSNNALKTLPQEFAQLSSTLTELNLRNNGFAEAPPLLSEFTHLKTLNLSQNQIVDAGLAPLLPLTQLKDLQLANNQLLAQTLGAFEFMHLETLNLSGNQLVYFPNVLHLHGLVTLDISNNFIKFIPAEISQLTNLKTLNVQSNQLDTLPTELGMMRSLKRLVVDNNPVVATLPAAKGNEAVLLAHLRSSAELANIKHSTSEGELASFDRSQTEGDDQRGATTPTPSSASDSYSANTPLQSGSNSNLTTPVLSTQTTPNMTPSDQPTKSGSFLSRVSDAAQSKVSRLLSYSPTFYHQNQTSQQTPQVLEQAQPAEFTLDESSTSASVTSASQSASQSPSFDLDLSPIVEKRTRSHSLPHVANPAELDPPSAGSLPSSPMLSSISAGGKLVESITEYKEEDFIKKLKLATNLKSSIDSFVARLRQRALDPDDLQEALMEFVGNTMSAVTAHPIWKDSSPAELLVARRGLQEYVLEGLYDMVFASRPQDRRKDDELTASIQRYAFVTPEHLEISGDYGDMWNEAAFMVQRINATKSCRIKMKTVVDICHYIIKFLSKSEEAVGADMLLPHLIYTVLQANPPQLYSNITYMSRFSDSSDSESIYYVTQLVACVHFIENLRADSLKIDPHEFNKLAHIPEKELVVQSNTHVRRQKPQRSQSEHSVSDSHTATGAHHKTSSRAHTSHDYPGRTDHHKTRPTSAHRYKDLNSPRSPALFSDNQVALLAEMFPQIDPAYIAECLKQAKQQSHGTGRDPVELVVAKLADSVSVAAAAEAPPPRLPPREAPEPELAVRLTMKRKELAAASAGGSADVAKWVLANEGLVEQCLQLAAAVRQLEAPKENFSALYTFEKVPLGELKVIDVPHIMEVHKRLISSHRTMTSLLYGTQPNK